ncbi:MAG: transporter [Bacteroidota bacterium]
MKKNITIIIFTIVSFLGFSQDDDASQKSVIQEYTPSILLEKGKWDIKWFNNLYTETTDLFGPNGDKRDIPRNTFFTSTVDIFTGISDNRRWNAGLLLEFRSNVVGGRDALDVFSFDGERNSARSGLTSISPAIKFNPLKSVPNFTIQSSLQIPLVDNETEDGVFLDQSGYIFQNRFFYDYSFAGGDWQLFTELNTEYNFPEEQSFADNALRLIPGVFLSYFPSSKFTVLGLVQHLQLISFEENGFEQDATIIGGGAKYQLTDELNIEFLYSNFVRGTDTGLGQTFNIGLRALF